MAKAKEVKKGDVFANLTVVEEVEPHIYPNGTKRRKFKLLCGCGNEVVANINNLRSGNTESCGCARKTHGMSNTRAYQCWADMKVRCDNTEHEWYPYYGGRGISYDPKWETFEGFWEDMGDSYTDDLTLSRIDNDANYCKVNCEWEGRTEQNHNRRKRITSTTWLAVIGGSYDNRHDVMYARIRAGDIGIHLGTFQTEDEVAEAYDMASEVIYGDRPNKTLETRQEIADKVRKVLERNGIKCMENKC